VQPTRLHLALATVLACTFAALCGALLASRGDDGGGALASAPGFRGALAPEGVPPMDFRLRDQDGRRRWPTTAARSSR
jgi:protein SCO1